MSAKFAEEALDAINKYRSIHQVEPLTYNHEIEGVAQDWADYLAKSNTFGHNPNPKYNGQHMGENVHSSWSGDQREVTGAEVAESWYREIEQYNFETHSGPNTGHFTQVVWKGSKEFGIGRAQAKDGNWMVVANFCPAGNYVGQNAKNVFPPMDGKIPTITNKTPIFYSGHQPFCVNPSRQSGEMVTNWNNEESRTYANAGHQPFYLHSSRQSGEMGTNWNNEESRTDANAGHQPFCLNPSLQSGERVINRRHEESRTDANGVKTVTVTETTIGPGPLTTKKVTRTVTKPGGYSTTTTEETQESSN